MKYFACDICLRGMILVKKKGITMHHTNLDKN